MLEITNKTHAGQRLTLASSNTIHRSTNLMAHPSNLIHQPTNLMAHPSNKAMAKTNRVLANLYGGRLRVFFLLPSYFFLYETDLIHAATGEVTL